MKAKHILIMLTALLLVLTGCNSAKSPSDALELFGKNMNEHKYREAMAYVDVYDGISYTSGEKPIIDAVAGSLRISIKNNSSNSFTSAITADVTTVDLRKVYKNAAVKIMESYHSRALSGEAISDVEIKNSLMAEIAAEALSQDAPTVTTECVFNLKSDSGKWYIVLDANTYNILLGYLTEANSLVESSLILQYGESSAVKNPTPDEPAPDEPAESPSDVSASNAEV